MFGFQKTILRSDDAIVRLGGDEFLIILPKTTQKEARVICKRITKKCNETSVGDVMISMSLGIACKESIEENFAEIIELAAINMYKNKSNYK